jgi:hypothetical protein
MMEKWNVGAKKRTILLSSPGLTALNQENDQVQPIPLFQFSNIPSFQRNCS